MQALFGSDLEAFRKIDPSAHSVSLVDCRRADAPLVYVNRGFEQLTGFTPAEVVGHNCRFLQGSQTDRDTVARMKQAIAKGLPFLADLLNYKKSGEPFWNRLSLRPVCNDAGQLTHYIGIQSDITALKHVEDKMVDVAVQLGRLPTRP